MIGRSPAGRPPRGQSTAHGLSGGWGSAGAMSGPPQLNKGRVHLTAGDGLSGGWGSAGAMSGPPQLNKGRVRLEAEDGCT
jgi:hypothetical protein